MVLYTLHILLAGQQPIDLLIDIAVHFPDDLPRELYVDRILVFLLFLLHKTEERSRGEILTHLFELRYQTIS